MSEKRIELSDLVTNREIKSIRAFIESHPGAGIHNCIMAWIERRKTVRSRWAKLGVIKAYGAYVVELYAL